MNELEEKITNTEDSIKDIETEIAALQAADVNLISAIDNINGDILRRVSF